MNLVLGGKHKRSLQDKHFFSQVRKLRYVREVISTTDRHSGSSRKGLLWTILPYSFSYNYHKHNSDVL